MFFVFGSPELLPVTKNKRPQFRLTGGDECQVSFSPFQILGSYFHRHETSLVAYAL